QHKIFIHYNSLRITPESLFVQMSVMSVVGLYIPLFTILLTAFTTLFALTATVDHTAYRSKVTHLKPAHVIAHLCDPADNLMSRYIRINGAVPFIACSMQIRMAHPAVQDVNFHILGGDFTTRDVHLF